MPRGQKKIKKKRCTGKDPAKAFHWYEKAAENGYGYAQRRLAQVYDEGYHNGLAGVERDRKKALYWYQKAAEQNVDGAQARYDWIMMDEQPDIKKKITSQAVLLCGNSTFHHLMLTKMLEQHGFGEIYKTDSVREAEKLYRKKKPGMVLLGLTVGGSVTTETVEMMDRKYPDAKIVLLVTMGQERMAEDLKRKYHVITDVLVSPYAKDRVGEVVLNVMRPKD